MYITVRRPLAKSSESAPERPAGWPKDAPLLRDAKGKLLTPHAETGRVNYGYSTSGKSPAHLRTHHFGVYAPKVDAEGWHETHDWQPEGHQDGDLYRTLAEHERQRLLRDKVIPGESMGDDQYGTGGAAIYTSDPGTAAFEAKVRARHDGESSHYVVHVRPDKRDLFTAHASKDGSEVRSTHRDLPASRVHAVYEVRQRPRGNFGFRIHDLGGGQGKLVRDREDPKNQEPRIRKTGDSFAGGGEAPATTDGWQRLSDWVPEDHRDGDLWRGIGHRGYRAFKHDGQLATAGRGIDHYATGGATYYASDPYHALVYAKGRDGAATAKRPRYLLHVRPGPDVSLARHWGGSQTAKDPIPARMVHAAYEIAPHPDGSGLGIRRAGAQVAKSAGAAPSSGGGDWQHLADWEPEGHKSGDVWRGIGHGGYHAFLRDGHLATNSKGADAFRTGGATYYATDPWNALEYAKLPTELGRHATADRPRYLLHVRPDGTIPLVGQKNGSRTTRVPIPAHMVHAAYEIAPHPDGSGLGIRRAGAPVAKSALAAPKSPPVASQSPPENPYEHVFHPIQVAGHAKPVQPVNNRDELYTRAALAQHEFHSLLNRGQGLDAHMGMAVFHPGEKPEPEHYQQPGGFIQFAPLKGQARATQKVAADYGGNWNRLGDVVRGSVAVDSLDDVGKIANYLHQSGAEVAGLKNRFAHPTPAGYRDGLMHLRMPSGVLAELQVHLKSVLQAKEAGHKPYETMRDIEAKYSGHHEDAALDPQDYRAYYGALRNSRDLYHAAWERAGGQHVAPLPEDTMLNYGGRRGIDKQPEQAPPLDPDTYAGMAKSDDLRQTTEEGHQHFVVDHHTIVRWVPGVGPQKETSRGWKPYRELVKFAHEAMPITHEEASRIRGGWVNRRKPRDDEE